MRGYADIALSLQLKACRNESGKLFRIVTLLAEDILTPYSQL